MLHLDTDGNTLFDRIRRRKPDGGLTVLTVFEEVTFVAVALEAGDGVEAHGAPPRLAAVERPRSLLQGIRPVGSQDKIIAAAPVEHRESAGAAGLPGSRDTTAPGTQRVRRVGPVLRRHRRRGKFGLRRLGVPLDLSGLIIVQVEAAVLAARVAFRPEAVGLDASAVGD